jgi:hypothetical protein
MNVDLVNDADYRGIDGRGLPSERFSCRTPFENDQDLLMHARPDAVHGQHRHAARRIVDAERLHEQQLGAVELRVLLCGDDGSDHSGYLHWVIE